MTALPTLEPWRFFDVEVAAVTRLSASFVRLTLTGPDLGLFADNGGDQRFKLLLPDAHGGYESLPRHEDWYAAWRRLPEDRRNPIRTYTARAVRRAARQVDLDLVLHGDAGPASRFAGRARVGDRAVVLGPNAEYGGPHGGVEFRPPPNHRGPFIVAADATAVPAALGILDALPEGVFGAALLEVPDASDVSPASAPRGIEVIWLVRGGGTSRLPDALDRVLRSLGVSASPRTGPPESVLPLERGSEPDEPLWEVPDGPAGSDLYAWIAGESGLVTALRRRIVRDHAVDRRSVAFMGYWREGRPGG